MKNITNFKVVSMNKIHYIENWRDCEGEEQNTPNVKYILNCINNNYCKYQIELSEKNGSCGSGWCNASFGTIDFKFVNDFGSYTHTPISDITFSLDIAECKQSELVTVNNIFNVDTCGGDEYYPSGSVSVNEELFIASNRYVGKPFVHIVHGDSNSGKSFLSHQLDKSIYETDNSEELPSEIKAEIIVVGNKYLHSLGDIKKRIPFDAHFIDVNFSYQP